jgi:2,3-bisphosphoglycerate-dependent phosphoglycerate mutase
MVTVVLLRHGQSEWNRDKRFTGWTDVALTRRGIAQAERAAHLMRAHDLTFDICFTSCLRRAADTARIVLDTMGLSAIPLEADWRLNERHYGALETLSHFEATRRYGPKQVLAWQRAYDAPPPPLDPADPHAPQCDPRWAGIDPALLPYGESLKETLARVLPYWDSAIAPALRGGRRVLVVAHHNALRALITHLEGTPERAVPFIRVPTAEPIVYRLDDQLRVAERCRLRCKPTLWQRVLEIWR